jgi:hypothetical protein
LKKELEGKQSSLMSKTPVEGWMQLKN